MERLADVQELLDGPLDDELALDANLRDLRRINRWLGGVRLSASAIDVLVRRESPVVLLDVGTGGADIPTALLERAARRGTRLQVVALDSRVEIIAAAVRVDPGASDRPGLELRLGDGHSLPFPDLAFDVAHCSLVLHHLDPSEAVALLAEMRRVSSQGVVVNDLDRGWLGWFGAWLLGHLLTRNPYTRHDAPMSVRRAYRPTELIALLHDAGLVPVRTFRGSFRQRYAIAARAASGPPP